MHAGRLCQATAGRAAGAGATAANLDALSPATRFAAVVLIWFSFLVGSEVLASRRASAPLVGALRLLAALGS